MEEQVNSFCVDPLWDSNLTWYTDTPDFTTCFHSTALVYVPAIFLALTLPIQAYRWRYVCKNRLIPWTILNISQMVGVNLLTLLNLIQLIIQLVKYTSRLENENVPTSPMVASAVLVVTFLTADTCGYINRKMGVISSGFLFIFWFLITLASTLTFTSVVRFPWKYSVETTSLFCIYYPILVATFFLQIFADAPPKHIDFSEQSENPSPETRASFASKITFSWFGSIIKTGWKKPLTSSDIYDLPPPDKCAGVVDIWNKHWNNQKEKKEKKSGTGVRLSVFPPLVYTVGGLLIESTVIRLFTVLLQQASPNILSLLINFTTSGEEVWKGYFYMILLVSSQLLNSILTSQYFYQNMIAGLRIRTVLTSAIFRKSLLLSPSARKNLTVGETVNLMSIDTQRLMDLMQSVNSFWSSPLSIALSLYFLFGYLGIASLAGLAVMIFLIPINALLSTRLRRYQFANMKTKDKRIRFMNEILDGIKVLKLYAWEPSFANKIGDIRGEEVMTLKKAAYLSAVQTFLFSAAPFLVALASFATFVLIDPNNVLDAETAFVSLSFFNLMRMPLNMIPSLIVQTVQALVSFERLNDFMNAKEIDRTSIQHKPDAHAVTMDNASFTWETDLAPSISNLSLKIKRGSFVAIVGRVGAGKSSLLSALTSDMEKVGGVVNVDGSCAYLPQQAWMQNATLRYNVTFGCQYVEGVYNKVLDACALRSDLEILAQSDMTEIGEKGINLSGGQKQRVSLARAVYSNRDIYLLDDPLSAVDSNVGKHIFDNVLGKNGLLKNKTRVLVTNSIAILPDVDQIFVFKDGSVSESGNYKELLSNGGAFAEFLMEHIQQRQGAELSEIDEAEIENLKGELEKTLGREVVERTLSKPESVRSNISAIMRQDPELRQRRTSSKPSRNPSQLDKQQQQPQHKGKRGPKDGGPKGDSSKKPGGRGAGGRGPATGAGRLMVDEKVETSAVKKDVYFYYARAVGLSVAVGTLLLQVVNQGFSLGTNFWLAKWSDDPKSSDPKVRDLYLGVYGALGGLSAITIMVSSLLVAVGGLNASSKLHNKMLENVLKAPMSFFDTNPKGRVVNRFAKDVDFVDRAIPMTLEALLRLLFQVGGTIVAISYTSPIFIALIIPLSFVYFFVQKLYVKTSRQLRRLESTSRSPIYSHFGETLSGTPTIRAFNLEDRFILENEAKVDSNQACYQPSIAANRWLAIRLEMLGNIIVLFAALFAVVSRDTIDPGLVGLSLSYASQITMSLNFLIRQTSQVETSMVSVERIQEYQDDLEREAPYLMPEQDPTANWPQYGQVEFKDYQTRYRDGLDLVLKGVSCQIMSGEKVGIVGRTGAGKSSLTLALFRIIEPVQGTIVIDDCDVTQMGLGFLRSRLTIIPQDPVLFSGTLRFNIDPFNSYTDEQIWNSLELSHLRVFVSNLPLGLGHEISEGGANLSVGQKQLVCLARALLRKTKILVLDEATAAVDLETDDLIQKTIRREFSDATVITIAHRLKTIMDYNRIIVMSDGNIAEFDSPQKLLEDDKSLFYSMAKDAGINLNEIFE